MTDDDDIQEYARPCPNCEYHRKRAQFWREEAYKLSGHPLPEQEPVAWSHAGAMPPEQEVMKEAAYNLAPWLSAALDDPKVCKEYKDVINAWFDAAMPAPQRTWVGLTDEEKADLFENSAPYYSEADYADAIEAKLKEKNT